MKCSIIDRRPGLRIGPARRCRPGSCAAPQRPARLRRWRRPTRLIEPARTSPTAKTPGTFDFERVDGGLGRELAAPVAGDDKAGLVEIDAAIAEPRGRWVGADEQEHVADGAGVVGAVAPVAPAHLFEPGLRVAVERDDFALVTTSMFGVASMRSTR